MSYISQAGAALRLRTALLAVVGAAPVPEAIIDMLSSASEDTWRLVLAGEACALPVVGHLRRQGTWDALSTSTQALILHRQVLEGQRVIAARALMADLDRHATALGIRVTLLKGSVPLTLAHRADLDLGDVDVLATPPDSVALWRHLVAEGWAPTIPTFQPSMDAPLTQNHFAALESPKVPFSLEVHERLRYGENPGQDHSVGLTLRQAPGYQALDYPQGATYIIALLHHSVDQHPQRRGHLRDLLLIADEMKSLSSEELETVRAEVAVGMLGPQRVAMFSQACALSRGESLGDHDLLRPYAAMKYLNLIGYGGALARIPNWLTLSFIALETRPVRRRYLRRRLRETLYPPPEGSRFARPRNAPGMPFLPLLLRATRAILVVVNVTLVISSGWMIRRDIRRALRAAEGS